MNLYKKSLTVKPEWVDYNGHMNVAYYVLAFDYSTDAVYESWGVGEQYIASSGCSLFTLGLDVDYLTELFPGDPIEITTQLLDWDHKRIHYYHRMIHAETGLLTAVNECLAMNIELQSRRSAPFPQSVQKILASVYAEHQGLEKPANSMNRLAIRRPRDLRV